MSTGEYIIVLVIAIGVLNSPFAIGVYRDAKSRSPVLAPAEAWAALTIVGGIFVVVAYWLLHMSTLSRSTKDADEARSGTA
jgi:hypothetical protein